DEIGDRVREIHPVQERERPHDRLAAAREAPPYRLEVGASGEEHDLKVAPTPKRLERVHGRATQVERALASTDDEHGLPAGLQAEVLPRLLGQDLAFGRDGQDPLAD